MEREHRKVTLKTPIEAHGKPYEYLVIRKPRVKELRATAGAIDDIDRSARLLAACAGIPVSSIDQMEVDDFTACNEALQEMLPRDPAETPLESLPESSRETGLEP